MMKFRKVPGLLTPPELSSFFHQFSENVRLNHSIIISQLYLLPDSLHKHLEQLEAESLYDTILSTVGMCAFLDKEGPWPALFDMPRKMPRIPGFYVRYCAQDFWLWSQVLPLYISARGTERKLVETGGQKEKEVGGVAIQCCANQAEKCCEGVRAKTPHSQVLPPPWPTDPSRTHTDARKNGGRVAGQSCKSGQCRDTAG